MNYRLLKDKNILANILFYDREVMNCAGVDLRVVLAKVTQPQRVISLQHRDLERTGRFNIVLDGGESVFNIDIERLLVVKFDW